MFHRSSAMKPSLASTLLNNDPISMLDSFTKIFSRFAVVVRGYRRTNWCAVKDDGGDARKETDSSASFPTSTSTTGDFSSLEEIEKILSLSTKVVNPKKMREAMEAEYEFFKYSGHIMPSTMTASMWEEMAFVKTVQRRLSLYTLFALREQYKEKKQREKLEKPSQKARYLQEKLRNEFGNLTSPFICRIGKLKS